MTRTQYAALGLAAITISLGSGCATISGSSNQSIAVQTIEKNGEKVADASCNLGNDKGSWQLQTPGSTYIQKSNNEINIKCEKDGHEPGSALVDSATGGAVWGNIILGGGIGWFVDHSSGSAYNYPPMIEIIMGEHQVLKPEPAPDFENTASSDEMN